MWWLLGCGSTEAASPNTTLATATGLRLVRIGTFHQPTYVTGAPSDDHRLFVVEKAGAIVVLVNGHSQRTPFLNITRLVESSGTVQGLLSMVFAPDYQRSGRLYLCYTILVTTSASSSTAARRTTPTVRIQPVPGSCSPRPIAKTTTTGGQLQFGPHGDLYVGVGDGGSEGDPMNLGQNTAVLDGKILRISPGPNGGYLIPTGNPFLARRGARPKI
ncbi:MAG: PQQ-dependent sugar dehydrogenase [Solirubrobacterales bacterium]|nr:PQQ-dependent sugar dehydrogenase [Solirubrobacterales bacterium]